MKEKLFNELKAKNLIPETLNINDVTEEYLINISLSQSASGNDRLSNEEFQELIYKSFDNKVKELGLDAIDKKYMKLPGVNDNSDEYKDLTEPEVNKRKMLHFVKSIFNQGAVTIKPNSTLALNTEGTTTTGGYTVPVAFIGEVSRLLNVYGAFRRNAKYMQINSYTTTMPKLNAAVSGAFVNETSAKGESNPTFTQITFQRNQYAFITGLSRQLLQDTGVDLIGLLAELAANDFAYTEDNQGFNGTGSPITGAFAAITDSDYITTTSGTNPNTLTYSDVIGLMTKPKTAGIVNAKWYMHRTVLGLILALVDDQTRPIFSTSEQAAVLASRTLLGYPIELSDAMATSANSASSKIILFGDLSKAAYFAEREGYEMRMSDTATVGSNSAFEKNLMFYRFEYAYDIEVHQPTALAKIVTAAS